MKSGPAAFLIVSLLTVATGAVIFFEASAYQKKCKVTEGVVDRSDNTYFYVNYVSDDGVPRTHKGSHSKNHKHRAGDKLKVFYLADSPDKSRITDGKRGGKIAAFSGVALLLLTLTGIYQNRKKTGTVNYLKTTGRKVQAEITGVVLDPETTVMHKHPYVINLRWVDPITGKEYTDTVKQIWKDPAPFLTGRTFIDVYIDRDDPNVYFTDTEFLESIKAY